jgi:hypothetical protein
MTKNKGVYMEFIEIINQVVGSVTQPLEKPLELLGKWGWVLPLLGLAVGLVTM